MDAARTRTKTSSSAGVGWGISSNSTGFPHSLTRIAFIFPISFNGKVTKTNKRKVSIIYPLFIGAPFDPPAQQNIKRSKELYTQYDLFRDIYSTNHIRIQ